MATSGKRDGVTTGREAIEVLVAARKERGLSQADLAGVMGVSASVVRRLESGGGSPRLDTLAAVAQGLGLRLDLRFVKDAAAASKGAATTGGRAKRGADAPETKAAGQGSRAKSPEAAKAKAATRPAAAKDQRKPAGARPSREVLPVKRTATRRRFT